MAYFALVARAGGISEAARQHGLSKSLLSRRLRQLEEHLGVILVERDSRRFVLSRIGVQYAELCLPLLEQADAARQLVTGLLDEPQGRLSVTVPIAFSEQTLARYLPAFISRYPAISVELHAGSESHDFKNIESDLYLAPLSKLPDTRLYAKGLVTVCDILVCHPDYARRHPVNRLDDLASMTLFARQEVSDKIVWTLQDRQGQTQSLPISPRMLSNSLANLLACAKDSDGVALLPDYYCRPALERGELVRLLPQLSGPARTLYAFYKAPREKNRLVDLFLGYLESALGS